MKWEEVVGHLRRDLGFRGDPADLAAVKLHMKAHGLSVETVEDDEGQAWYLDDLHDSWTGAELDRELGCDVRKVKKIDKVAARRRTSGGDGEMKEHRAEIAGRKGGRWGYDEGFGAFLLDVKQAGIKEGGQVSERLALIQKATLSTYGSEGVGADGGFAVPPEFRAEITERVLGESSILGMTDQFPLAGNTISFPDDEGPPWATSGGPQATWEGEATTIEQSKPELKEKELKLRKCTALVPVTEELLEDSMAMGAYVPRKAGTRLAWKVDEAIFRGTGSGQPLGFMASPSLITVAKVGSQVADTITWKNVFAMFVRQLYPGDAVWFVHPAAAEQLYRLRPPGQTSTGNTTTGFGSGDVFVPGGVEGGVGRLLGRPVLLTQHAATLGDLGDIVFASMKQYATAIKSTGVESAQSMHIWFDQDVVAFKFRMRVDGQPWLSTTVSPRDGSNTMSAFVALAARA